jgi:hypothetical protein
MSSATEPKTIVLGGVGIQQEAVAGGAITPGMLVERNAQGEYVVHADADGEAQPTFAKEYDLTGRGIDDAYAEGDQVIAETLPQGAYVYAHLAASQTIAVGDELTSNGNGSVKEAGNTSFRVGRALEAVTTTGSPGRVKMEVMTGRGA